MAGDWLPLTAAAPGQSHQIELHADSPWFDGHFPGNPLVPGVALLAFAWEAARRRLAEQGRPVRLAGLKQIRFRKFVVPPASLELTVAPAEEGREDLVRFVVLAAGETACSGVLVLAPLEAAP